MKDALAQTCFDMWMIIHQGGWVMYAIFAAGQLGWFLILERWWFYRKMAKGKAKGLLGQVSASVNQARPMGHEAMIAKARESLHEHVPELSRHLGTLAILAGAAPLLGLTGTVAGIMQTFRVITLYGAGNPSMMAGGIAQALMVTEAGLVVAFPLLLCHDHLQKRADALEDDCVAAVTRLIRSYSRGGAA